MSDLIYVDNSNLYIAAMQEHEEATGQTHAPGEYIANPFRIDFKKLYQFLVGPNNQDIKRCLLVGSEARDASAAQSAWSDAARYSGFEVKIEGRNIADKEKRVDTRLVAEMMRDAFTKMDKNEDVITLVSGDADFIPAVEILAAEGFAVEVTFWEKFAARRLREDNSWKFIDMTPHLSNLQFKR